VLDNLYDGVYFVDLERRISYWNKGAERLTGYTAEEVIGRFCFENLLQHVDTEGTQLCFGACPLALCMAERKARSARVYLRHKAGHRVPISVRVSPIYNQKGEVTGAVEIFSDIVPKEDMRARIEELEKLAMVDGLTGLPNRRYLENQLEARMGAFQRYGWPFGVLFMDIDHFKRVNDTYGHEVGDLVLKMVGRTLSASARVPDTIGRWGGEEFLAVVTNVALPRLIEIGNRFRHLTEASALNEPAPIRVTLSLGAAVPRTGETLGSLLLRADRLLYQAKESGRNVLCAEESS
jgi:diguanylate cyclase (GGDEF)-like protein/PAS domain S-box-containing protein